MGAYPRVSPDGRYVATASGVGRDRHAARRPVATPSTSRRSSAAPGGSAWSPDGRQLAGVRHAAGTGRRPQVLLFDWDGTSLTPADPGKPDNPGSSSPGRPTARSHQRRWTGRRRPQPQPGRQLRAGSSGSTRREWCASRPALESGDRPPIEGLPEALAADW